MKELNAAKFKQTPWRTKLTKSLRHKTAAYINNFLTEDGYDMTQFVTSFQSKRYGKYQKVSRFINKTRRLNGHEETYPT